MNSKNGLEKKYLLKELIRGMRIFGIFMFFSSLINLNSIQVLDTFSISFKDEYHTEEQLRTLAIKKGIIPAEPDKKYLKKQIEQKNTIILWLLMNRQEKIKMIDALKNMFLAREGIKIKRESEYYVDQINNVLYKSLLNDEAFVKEKKGIGVLLKTIAVMEGDYDDGSGRSKVEILKDFLGEEQFEWYKEKYPHKLKYLQELDRQLNNK